MWGPGCRLQLLFSWSQGQDFYFSYLLAGDPLGLHQSWPGIAHQLPQTWSHLPSPRMVCRAASFLWGFPKGVCTRSCSESLCLRQGLPDRGELGLLFLGVPEPGSVVGRRDQSRQRGWRWGKSPAASDRKSWVLPLLFSFFLFPYLKEKKYIKTTPKLSRAPQKTKYGPVAAAPLHAGGMFPRARCLLTSFESALGLAPRAAAPPATFLVKCAWIGL